MNKLMRKGKHIANIHENISVKTIIQLYKQGYNIMQTQTVENLPTISVLGIVETSEISHHIHDELVNHYGKLEGGQRFKLIYKTLDGLVEHGLVEYNHDGLSYIERLG